MDHTDLAGVLAADIFRLADDADMIGRHDVAEELRMVAGRHVAGVVRRCPCCGEVFALYRDSDIGRRFWCGRCNLWVMPEWAAEVGRCGYST